MRASMLHLRSALAIVGLGPFWAVACSAPLDTTRKPVDEGTFGELAFTLACQRLAYSRDLAGGGPVDVRGDTYREACRGGALPAASAPDPAIAALHAERSTLIAAIDTAFPASLLPRLQAYLASDRFLALYDDGTLERAALETAEVLSALADDPDLAPALGRLDGRRGYRPPAAAPGLLAAVLRHDRLEALLGVLADNFAPGGPAHEALSNLLGAVSLELANGSLDPEYGRSTRTLSLAAELLLGESPLLGTGRPRLLTVRDHRGLARVELDPETGLLPPPFSDADGDGLADVFPAEAPPPFPTPLRPDSAPRDGLGRALLSEDGQPLYRYVDLDRTVLVALAEGSRELFDPLRGTAVDLVRGLGALAGRRAPSQASYADGASISYQGFVSSSSALLDLAYAYLTLARDPNLPAVLGVVRDLFLDHEAETSRLMEAILETADLGGAFPEAARAPGSAFFDDLVPVVVKILAVPNLAEDLIRVLGDPAVVQLADRLARFLRYRDRFGYDPHSQEVIGSFGAQVDRARSDSGWNRSLAQRLLHLIADSSGVTLCNKDDAVIRDPLLGIPLIYYGPCALFRINDLAVFYVQSMAYLKDQAGHVVRDAYGRPVPKAQLDLDLDILDGMVTDEDIEEQSTIKGFGRHPTPAALNRVLLLEPPPALIADIIDPVTCKDGDRYQDVHADTLQVWELDGFYDQIRPIIQAFADHQAEGLLVELLVVLQQHYPSDQSADHQGGNPAAHGYAKRSDLRSFEPLVVSVFESTELWPAVSALAPVLARLSRDGKAGSTILADAGRYLFSPQASLTRRDGTARTATEDGRPVTVLSPWYVLADAYRVRRLRLDEAGPAGQAWPRAISEAADLWLRGELAEGRWRFRNPRLKGVAVAFLDFGRERLLAHEARGDLTAWTTQELPEAAEELVMGPLFATGVDLVEAVAGVPSARAALEDLAADLGGNDLALTAAADALGLGLDDPDVVPLLRGVGRALDPGRGVLDAQLELLRDARNADADGTLTDVASGLAAEPRPGRSVAADIALVLGEVLRVEPLFDLGQPLGPDDFRAAFRASAHFLSDDPRGLKKIFDIVVQRKRP